MWDIEVSVITNPMASFKKEDENNENHAPLDIIDATTNDGISQLESLRLPVKIMRT